MMLYICVKFHQNIWNGFQLTEWTRVHSRNGYFQYLLCSNGHNSKSRLSRVTVFLVCMLSHGALHFLRNFIIISGTVFNLQLGQGYMVEMAMFNVQRAITPKVGKPELLFMCSECSLIVLYICVKFCENIFGRYQSYGVDTNDGSADGQTGPRKDRHSKFWMV